jgi:hypothetical protein
LARLKIVGGLWKVSVALPFGLCRRFLLQVFYPSGRFRLFLCAFLVWWAYFSNAAMAVFFDISSLLALYRLSFMKYRD